MDEREPPPAPEPAEPRDEPLYVREKRWAEAEAERKRAVVTIRPL